MKALKRADRIALHAHEQALCMSPRATPDSGEKSQ